MDLPQELDDFIRESIDHSLGLPVSTETLQTKLRASEDAQLRLRNQYFVLLSKLKEKDHAIERARAEASLNAQAVKKFVEENKKLALECANLLNQCNKWERECSLYDHDREALMDFGNEADERAKDAEGRVTELEGEVRRLNEELRFYKHEHDKQMANTTAEGKTLEENLLETVLATFIGKDATASAHAFLEAYTGEESCQRLLHMWNCLRPSTQKVLALAAEVKALEKDKDHLRINLHRAEEEVKVLFEENNILDKENKKLLKLYHKERNHQGSGGKHTSSASAKSNKRKSSPKISSPIEKKTDYNDKGSARQPLSPFSSPVEKKIDFSDKDSARQPLSPLQFNSRLENV